MSLSWNSGSVAFGCSIDSMINSNMYDQFFEDSLVQMIMFHDFQLSYVDIAGQKWSEVDTVDDLLTAQEIHRGN